MKTIFLLLFLFSFIHITNAQEASFRRVPRQISLETGYKNIFSTTFDNNASHGGGFMIDYAWKLSGFSNNKAAYISVPLGYWNMNADGSGNENMKIISYGWTVKHELAKNRKMIPFAGYSLLLNQLSINNTDGKVFGHQTKFDLGADFYLESKIIPFIKVEYSSARFPALNDAKGNKMHTWEFKMGVRFNSKQSD
ncbi:MAG: hypothetical protein JXA77_15310 [Bacteroidales bacterium]|nr:hypothetical protein [Bacteroidales bacterium]MBN2820236.1 hypothetical protein [Bacteroidales bacterium]